jgi:hypothetical protein
MFTLNAWAIRILAQKLHEKFKNARLISCFSSSKEDWFLQTNQGIIQIQFFQQIPYFLFPESTAMPVKKRLPFIKFETEEKIQSIHAVEGDRAFWIEMNHFQILFNLFGSRSEIFLFEDFKPVKRFRKPAEPMIEWPSFNVNETAKAAPVDAKDFLTLSQRVKTFPDFLETEATERNFFHGRPMAEVHDFLKNSFSGKWYLHPGMPPTLSLSDGSSATAFDNPLEAVQSFSTQSLRVLRFEARKNTALLTVKTQIKKLEQKIKSLETTLNRRNTQTGFSQLGDILMANLHVLTKGMKDALLFNFYSNSDEKIPLKPELNPQQNAERYYRKGKQEHVEISFLKRTLDELQAQLLQAKRKLDELELVEKHVQFEPSVEPLQLQAKRKIFVFEVEGYEIWVGRNAKENDELLRLSHKNDLWLHARDIRGSHVIIRCGNRPKPPEIVLERAAQLAAYNSGAKGSEWVPVMIAERKHVRKKKGLAAGEVIVERETTVMAEPVK